MNRVYGENEKGQRHRVLEVVVTEKVGGLRSILVWRGSYKQVVVMRAYDWSEDREARLLSLATRNDTRIVYRFEHQARNAYKFDQRLRIGDRVAFVRAEDDAANINLLGKSGTITNIFGSEAEGGLSGARPNAPSYEVKFDDVTAKDARGVEQFWREELAYLAPRHDAPTAHPTMKLLVEQRKKTLAAEKLLRELAERLVEGAYQALDLDDLDDPASWVYDADHWHNDHELGMKALEYLGDRPSVVIDRLEKQYAEERSRGLDTECPNCYTELDPEEITDPGYCPHCGEAF